MQDAHPLRVMIAHSLHAARRLLRLDLHVSRAAAFRQSDHMGRAISKLLPLPVAVTDSEWRSEPRPS